MGRGESGGALPAGVPGRGAGHPPPQCRRNAGGHAAVPPPLPDREAALQHRPGRGPQSRPEPCSAGGMCVCPEITVSTGIVDCHGTHRFPFCPGFPRCKNLHLGTLIRTRDGMSPMPSKIFAQQISLGLEVPVCQPTATSPRRRSTPPPSGAAGCWRWSWRAPWPMGPMEWSPQPPAIGL